MRFLCSLLFSILFLANLTFSQEAVTSSVVPVDEGTNLITYQEVVEVDGTKKELFHRCIDWVNNFYTNPVSVTKVRDFESGKIKGNHQFRITFSDDDGYQKNAGTILYSFLIQFKDGRYRYTISDFVLKKKSRFPVENWLDKSDPSYNPQWDKYIKQVDEFAQSLISDLKSKMQQQEQETDDDW